MSQLSFSSLAYASKKKVTRREQFLSEMEAVTPWAMLEDLIEPHYPKGEQGRPPMALSMMLRIYFMQQWFQLSDPAMEDALYDSQSNDSQSNDSQTMQRVCGSGTGTRCHSR